MNRFINILVVILSFPKSFYVCMKLMPFLQAVRLPLLVRYNTRICSLRGACVLKDCHFAMVKFGFGSVDHLDYQGALRIDGVWDINGRCFFGQGTTLSIGKNSRFETGENVVGTGGLLVYCHLRMSIGSNCLISWNTQIFDTDFHSVRDIVTGMKSVKKEDVKIGDDVWICSNVTILKGTSIGNGCIVSNNTVVTRSIKPECNSLLAGIPAKVIKNNVALDRN